MGAKAVSGEVGWETRVRAVAVRAGGAQPSHAVERKDPKCHQVAFPSDYSIVLLPLQSGCVGARGVWGVREAGRNRATGGSHLTTR